MFCSFDHGSISTLKIRLCKPKYRGQETRLDCLMWWRVSSAVSVGPFRSLSDMRERVIQNKDLNRKISVAPMMD